MKFKHSNLLILTLLITLFAGSGCDLFGGGDSNNSGDDGSDTTTAVACELADFGYCQEISGAAQGVLEAACSAASGTVGGEQCSEHSQNTALATCAKTTDGITYTEYYGETYMNYSLSPGFCTTVKGGLQALCEAAGGTFTDVEGRFAAYACP
jgi:hypothetical protein